jgi:hypothetical protein
MTVLGISPGVWLILVCLSALALALCGSGLKALLTGRAKTRFGEYGEADQPRVYRVAVVVKLSLGAIVFAMVAMVAMLARAGS